jgi:hypothetical protein
MKKSLIIGGVIIGAVLLARRFVKVAEFDWEKVFERMPDSAPPKWMFRNITAIRENTDRILERLGETRQSKAGERTGTAA